MAKLVNQVNQVEKPNQDVKDDKSYYRLEELIVETELLIFNELKIYSGEILKYRDNEKEPAKENLVAEPNNIADNIVAGKNDKNPNSDFIFVGGLV